MITIAIIETATGTLDGADEPCPAVGANLIALMSTEARGRFVERFAERTRLNPETGCIEWTGGMATGGYGGVRITRNATSETHRAAYVLACGPIPKGLMVLHGCHNPRCVNPAHLRLGTHAENMRDKVEAGRAPRGPGSHPRKLTAEDAWAVIGDHILGITLAESARDLGVLPNTVSKVRAWKRRGAAMSACIDAFLAAEAAERDLEPPV